MTAYLVERIRRVDLGPYPTIFRLCVVLGLLFIFLIGVNTLSASFKMMGVEFAQTLFNLSTHPLVSLFVGILATVLVQSSSTTTAIIVGLCSSGTLSIGGAVPMIMGANLGTSVTNTLVSLSYIKNKQNFTRAFSAATVHDIFNILTVIFLLPLELATGILEKTALTMAQFFYGASSNIVFNSPLKAAIKPVTKGLEGLVVDTWALEGVVAGTVLMLVAIAIIICALGTVIRVMKTFVDSHKGDIVEKLLSKNPVISIGTGALLTIMVQSSSITTSLLVPLAGVGLLSTRTIFPVTIGANIGTTATAIIASLTGNMAGLAIALVHFLFNLLGLLMWYPSQFMRRVPLSLAERLGEMVAKNRLLGIFYVGFLFFLLPLALIFI